MSKNMRMYSDYFGIRENAFSITPDPRYLFMSERHREALAHLLFGTEEGGGFVLLTGEVGTGKTTICRAFLEQLPENVDVALLLNPPDNARELLLAIISELRLPVPRHNARVRELVELLNEHLLKAHADGRRTVVLIDEAQNISPEVLEQVRLLTNLETATHKLLQVFLIGQPELRQKLERPSLRQVTQRITARYHLEPLSLAETRDYIRHRLAVAGCRQGLFNPAAVKQIYHQSQGIPRVINILCDRALIGAFATDTQEVNAKIVRHAAREWRGLKGRGKHPFSHSGIAAAVAGIVIAGASVYIFNAGIVPAGGLPVPAELSGHNEADGGVESTAADTPASSQAEVLPGGLLPTANRERSHSAMMMTTELRNTSAQEPTGATAEDRATSVSGVLQKGAPVALQALLGRWGIHNATVNHSIFCDEVDRFGLQCLREKGGWRTLRSYNRPALLNLQYSEGKKTNLAIVGMNKDHAVVATTEGPSEVSLTALEPYWNGEFVILWHPPLKGVPLIANGSGESEVRWLQNALGRIDGKVDPVTVFDPGTEQRVRDFQRSKGLVADGIVGPKTFIHLNTQTGEGTFPVLWANNGS